MKRLKLGSVIALASVAAMSAISGASAQEVNFRLAHWLPPTHPVQTMGLDDWTNSIREASGGKIDFTIFPAQQLGSAPDHYDMTRDGIADIGYINPGYQAGRFPIYGLTEVPFNVKDAVNGSVALHKWYANYAEQEMPEVKLCLVNPHDPGTIHSKMPVRVPEDINGHAVRPAHATMARFVNLLGGASVQVPAPEAREAIAKGTADAITFPWNSIYIFGIDQETKYHLDMPFYVSSQILVINRGVYDGLSAENRKVMDDHCTPEWSGRFSKGWAENEASGRDKMMASDDHELYQPTADELQQWRDAAEPLVAQWRESVTAKGGDADAIYKAFIDALEAENAKY
ncbi:MAG: TRAP transporter substrate-binding protein [Thalassospira sp.]|uniref:TRAP transporter substrate-binding protein n=1 Tax=Thalassospira sp. TaxID=1912094 RepID=UPI001B2E9909|nr:TRAP transporter substrate-binding protein [Thalassospira sp.]MBO6578786.1 TRAP transporter substrate-binding protein [Thalassospira sp.]MBO6802210.1 TRAP transporter substrate-binding protein [Thalassospira sp.]MBO6818403.1 TRAP transporter substrate-binding protein [Thalassospira sp.]MBO6888043.1 TRAP transporter substrate-binding protein [Thalassospira sp.]